MTLCSPAVLPVSRRVRSSDPSRAWAERMPAGGGVAGGSAIWFREAKTATVNMALAAIQIQIRMRGLRRGGVTARPAGSGRLRGASGSGCIQASITTIGLTTRRDHTASAV